MESVTDKPILLDKDPDMLMTANETHLSRRGEAARDMISSDKQKAIVMNLHARVFAAFGLLSL